MVAETRADHPLSLTVDHLKARRLRVGLSQADLDHVAGFPSGRVAHWECGMQKPSLASLLIWADCLYQLAPNRLNLSQSHPKYPTHRSD